MTTTREEQRDAFATLNYRSVAKWERKQGREELARVIESAADEIDHLRSASQAGGVPAGALSLRDLKREIANTKNDLNGLALIGCVPLWSSLTSRLDELYERLSASPPPPATDGDALREALAPFARLITAFEADLPDDTMVRVLFGNTVSGELRVSDLRLARNALASSPPLAATESEGLAQAAAYWKTKEGAAFNAISELCNPDASINERFEAADRLRSALGMPLKHTEACPINESDEPCASECTCGYWNEPTPVSATDAVEAERTKWAAEVAEISGRLRVVEKIQGIVRADERKACEAAIRAVIAPVFDDVDSGFRAGAIAALSAILARGTETGEEWGHGRRWNERADRLNEAVLAEREACAKVADREERLREGSAIFACIAIAAVIRARSKADSALGADASTEGGVDV